MCLFYFIRQGQWYTPPRFPPQVPHTPYLGRKAGKTDENPNQPKEDDAILGGNAPIYRGVVLGGIEGVKGKSTLASFDRLLAR